MPNPLSGIITSEFKTTYTNAISALLEDSALTAPCTFVYGNTKTTDCSNCVYDAVGKKSANRYQTGGPIPFASGQPCPMCGGAGRIFIDAEEENIYLMIIWDSKSWLPSTAAKSINNPENYVQSISVVSSTLAKILRAKDVIMDTRLSQYAQYRYQRYGAPEPCGFSDEFISTMWEKVS